MTVIAFISMGLLMFIIGWFIGIVCGREVYKHETKENEDKTIVICENCSAKNSIKDTFKLITNNIDNFEFIAVTEMEKIRGNIYKKILVTRAAWNVLYNTHKDEYARDILEPLEAAGTTVAGIDL